jgi:ABC-type nitrate/sulfonate/bicarbonate transport system substrate-binding protein
VTFLEPVARDDRIARLRGGEADIGFMDVGAFVETVAAEPGFDARCVFVAGQRLPMSAIYVQGSTAGGRAIGRPGDLLEATYGGESDSPFVLEHQALLRRLGGLDPRLHVEIPYDDLFGALGAGEIDIAPDYAGIGTSYARALRPGERIGVLPYRDCGVTAYGTGFMASGSSLRGRRDALKAFLAVVADAYVDMRADPEQTIDDATRLLPGLDREYALAEWREEEEHVIFGYGPLGGSEASLWAETAAWRGAVSGLPPVSDPVALFEDIGLPAGGYPATGDAAISASGRTWKDA